MKRTKRIASVLLALVMALSLITTAFAAGETGSITINNPVAGQTYDIYRMFDLESYDSKTGAYSYKITNNWKEFVTTGEGSKYFTVNNQGYVTMKNGVNLDSNSEQAAALAKAALAYAKDKKLTPDATLPKDGSYVANGLPLGYYLIDSSLGTLCGLTTTKPNATVNEKNAEPTNVKEVEEDSNNTYGKANDADIGQTVNFKSTITAQAGAENYVFHDEMSAGLTFGTVTGVTLNGNTVDAANYTVKTTGLADKCTFEVEFTQAFCDTLKANDQIVISYTAVVNDKAVVGGAGNPNESKIEYGENGKTTTTPPSTTRTYTWDMNVLKYGNGDKNNVLSGAQFVLLNKDKTKVATVVNGKLTGWVVVPTAGEDGTIAWPENTVLTTDSNGTIHIDGLDSDTYYLHETKAPDGYNKLADDVEVNIVAAAGADNTLSYTTVKAEINNNTGAQLPSTGGIGTTIFYVVGGLLVVAAGVLLVTRKRMSKSED